MSTLANPFTRVIADLNGVPARPLAEASMTELDRIRKRKEAKLYITMQQVMAQVTDLLAPGEQLINLMAMTNEQNSGMATDGIMGMYAPKSQRAKAYIKEQASLRGNRLMAFTDRRIIFFIVIEFLDDPTAYFSYKYSDIKAIALREKHLNVPSDGTRGFIHRKTVSWYFLDFQTADGHIFSESLTEANGALFKQNLLTIPGMADIEVSRRITRRNKFDFVMSNVSLGWKLLLGLLAVVFLPVLYELVKLLIHALIG
ncbi:hypothetical protein [Lacticaseibacillus mingshuiensis]|uniref:hypothetical protein n=1 Tax=Lacticaseibacillus mingshuiensis TaxID=2799574 RepID=UPI0019521628|nr:hypothetical protein [Lacticaseibacillus mingshuiensis]